MAAATPTQIRTVRELTLDGLARGKIAQQVGLCAETVRVLQKRLRLCDVAQGNADRAKAAALAAKKPKPKPRKLHPGLYGFCVPIDRSPSPAGDFVRLSRPDGLPPVTLSPATGLGPRMGLLGAFLAFVLGTAGLMPAPAQAQAQAGAISGRVVDTERVPVGGAQVGFEHLASGHSPSRHTNGRGRYTQRGLRTDGPYRVWIHKPGYRWETALVNAPLLRTATHDVQLLRSDECQVPAQPWRYRIREREREPCNAIELLPPPDVEAAMAATPTPTPTTTITTWVCESGRCFTYPTRRNTSRDF